MEKMRSIIKASVAQIHSNILNHVTRRLICAKKARGKSLSNVLSPMVVIVNITGKNNGQNSDQNFNLIATINWAAPIYENNIRHTSVKN